ncbi:DUF6279 family lipoprotein [Variovorax terrae]|uniref:DUF6279 family lipoprotein n=1 Tax=Variovorax terrae TaxID=2923278 RepID=A0A9X1VZ81_9BURK|nr:DUF6279 family lipoprotein [Variovorax terrae]MCJ0764879.1 DUF6279 family lipoprotein [Variovorax terrae]
MTTPLRLPPGIAGTVGRIIGLLALAALLQACSAIKLVYNNAPDLTYWWLDGYVDFNEAQTLRARQDLARLHQWHRSTELPRYADLLQKVEQMAAADVTPEQVCAVLAQIQGKANTLADQAEPAVVALALSLTPDQLKQVERKYEKTDTAYRKDWVRSTPKEQQEKRYKQVLERSEMIYGRLDDAQRDVIRQQVALSSFDGQVSYAERLRRQQDLLQTLRKLQAGKPTPEEARLAMRGYLERAMNSPNPAYRSYQQTLMQEGCRSFAVAHNSTTPAQRETAVRRLQAYERDLRELATQK